MFKRIAGILTLVVFKAGVLHAAGEVSTELHIEYTNKQGEVKSILRQQSFASPLADRDSAKKFGLSFELATSPEYPLQVVISNVWESLENKSLPAVFIPFEIETRKVESGRVYICPQIQNEQAGCRVQLTKARLDLQVPTEELVCKMKIETSSPMDFKNSLKILTASSFPSSQFPGAQSGEALALIFECSNRGQVMLKGHFRHNQIALPSFTARMEPGSVALHDSQDGWFESSELKSPQGRL